MILLSKVEGQPVIPFRPKNVCLLLHEKIEKKGWKVRIECEPIWSKREYTENSQIVLKQCQ